MWKRNSPGVARFESSPTPVRAIPRSPHRGPAPACAPRSPGAATGRRTILPGATHRCRLGAPARRLEGRRLSTPAQGSRRGSDQRCSRNSATKHGTSSCSPPTRPEPTTTTTSAPNTSSPASTQPAAPPVPPSPPSVRPRRPACAGDGRRHLAQLEHRRHRQAIIYRLRPLIRSRNQSSRRASGDTFVVCVRVTLVFQAEGRVRGCRVR